MRSYGFPALSMKTLKMPHGMNKPKSDDDEERDFLVNTAHGMHIIVGPTGSGKTMLAVHFARSYVGKRCNLCAEGTACHKEGGKKWRVVTNMQNPKVLEWAEYLEDLDQLDDEEGHIIGIIDEIHQFADSRRSMREDNIVISRLLAQARKSTTKLYVTSQSVGKVDVRLRNEAKVFWNVWNPDQRGITIGAVVQKQSDGSSPPWARANPRPVVRFFNTRGTRDHYDTYEVIEDGALRRRSIEKTLRFVDANGNIVKAPLSGVVRYGVLEEVKYRFKKLEYEPVEVKGIHITAAEIAEIITEKMDLRPPLRERDVRRSMSADGYEVDGQLGYWFPAGKNVRVKADDAT